MKVGGFFYGWNFIYLDMSRPIINTVKLLAVCFLLCSCNRNYSDKYNLVFYYNNWIKIDFKSKTLHVNYIDLHYTDTVIFTKNDVDEITRSFDRNNIGKIKEHQIYGESKDIVIPPTRFGIKVYFSEKLQSEFLVEYDYPRNAKPPITEENRVVNFRNDVLKVLEKNLKLKKAVAIFDNYQSKHPYSIN